MERDESKARDEEGWRGGKDGKEGGGGGRKKLESKCRKRLEQSHCNYTTLVIKVTLNITESGAGPQRKAKLWYLN